ncbi:MAG TPA: glycosyltransferase family 2 protein [Aequorivita sp.]|nr:glycosyltransferase family 2 protein [Aequorivita sp.]
MSNKVSIIIPTYNRAHLIGETLESVMRQTYHNWECIIVDDGSTDNTYQVVDSYVKKDGRFQYHKRPNTHNKGGNGARNYGFELSDGSYIKWFDSDDLMLPTCLQEQVDLIAQQQTDVCVCKLKRFSSEQKEGWGDYEIESSNLIADYLIGNISFYVCCPLWNRAFLKGKELFDEKVSTLDDWDFNLRMLYENPRISFLDKALILYRLHENSLVREIPRFNVKEIESEIYTRKKHLVLLKQMGLLKERKLLEKYLKKRYKYFTGEALLRSSAYGNHFYKALLISQIKLGDFFGLLQTTVGYFSYKLFKRGYVFFK